MSFKCLQCHAWHAMQARRDFTSYSNDRIILADFGNSNMTFISPQNATHPHGSCNYSAVPDFLSGAPAVPEAGAGCQLPGATVCPRCLHLQLHNTEQKLALRWPQPVITVSRGSSSLFALTEATSCAAQI